MSSFQTVAPDPHKPHFHGPLLNNPALVPTALDLPLQRQFNRCVASGQIPLDPVLRFHLNQITNR